MATKKKEVLLAQNDPETEDPNDASAGFGLPLQEPDEDQIDAQALGLDLTPPVDAQTGVPTGISNPSTASNSVVQQLLASLNSPERKARLAELSKTGQEAIDQQRQGIQNSEDAFNQLQARGPQTNLAPLAALSDAWTGSNLAGHYKQPDSPDERAMKMLQLRDAINKEKQGLSQEQINFIKSQLSGQMDPLNAAAKLSQINKYDENGPLAKMQDARLTNQNRKDILAKLANDKVSRDRLVQYQNLNNALTNMAAGKIRTPQQLDDFQQVIAKNLGIQGTSGVGEREKRYIDSLGLNSERWAQFFTGKPQDISKMKDLLAHLQDLAKQEQNSVHGQYGKRLKALTSGYDSTMAKHPELRSDIDNAINAYGEQFDLRQAPDLTTLKPGQRGMPQVKNYGKSIAAPQPAASQGGPQVGQIEDGHRFLGGDPADPKSWEEVK